MTIRIFTFLFLIFLISCKKPEKPVNKFIGIWYDTEYIIPGKSSIKINKDSTFNYSSAGCDWRVFSKGNWKIIGDSIELSSVKIDTCYFAFSFLDCAFFDRRGKKPLVTIPNCEADGRKDFCIFSNETFYLRNDSLVYKIKTSSKCPDTLKIIFARTEKIRK